MRPWLVAMPLAALPAWPSINWLAVVVSVVLPMAVCRIGTPFCPSIPWLPQLVTPVFLVISPPRAMVRLFCAIWNSLRKPFSKILISLRPYSLHSLVP